MKIHPALPAAFFLAIISAEVGVVEAQTTPIVYTVQEDGQGTFSINGSPAASMGGSLSSDPGPGGLAAALTYVLPGINSIVAGDLFLYDASPLANLQTPANPVSDFIRFNPPATFPPTLVFYSLAPGPDAADTGFPIQYYVNNLSLPEGPGGITTYTPNSTQPGFVPGFDATYIISSPEAVPEPSACVLLGCSMAIGAVLFGRRKARSLSQLR